MEYNELLLKVIESTDSIYNYIGKRLYNPATIQTLNKRDLRILGQHDGLYNQQNIYIEECYEYFLTRISVGINYFIKKVDTKGSKEEIAKSFKKYLFNYFLKYLIIDFNRKKIRAEKRNMRKNELYTKFLQLGYKLRDKEKSIIELYLNKNITQAALALELNTSRPTISRAIKKLEKLEL